MEGHCMQVLMFQSSPWVVCGNCGNARSCIAPIYRRGWAGMGGTESGGGETEGKDLCCACRMQQQSGTLMHGGVILGLDDDGSCIINH